jgi:phage terminase large subunit-like protein
MAHGYALDVVGARIPACKWVRLACQRHLDDLERAKDAAWPYRYDCVKGGRVCRFIELLPHVKGKWAKKDPKTGKAQRIRLEAWQAFKTCMLFGWVKKENGMRRFRKASIYEPRKNAKSTWAVGVGYAMLAKDDEPGAEIYSGATSEKQAWETFGPARRMLLSEPRMADGLKLTALASAVVREADGSKWEPVIGKPGDGASPHLAIIDEYHEHDTSDLRDTMETGMGAREQPLSLIISTAGANLAGPCREDWKACEKILNRVPGFEDDTHFCLIYTIDDGDAWDSELALRKANPNFDVSVSRDFLMAQLATARRDARAQSTFKTKHLNVWTSAKSAFYNVEEWNACARPELRIEQFAGKPCFLSADFASKHDLVALMALFPIDDKSFAAFGKYYLPRATVDLPENQHYRAWESAGFLTVTEGNITDIDVLIDDAVAMNGAYQVLEMPFDPNRAWGVSTRLQARGLNVIEYRNTVLTMSEPMKELGALAKAGRIHHNGDPVLAWAISNVTGEEDKKQNVYPNRESPAQKIDPVVSLLFALGRAKSAPVVKPVGGFSFA